MKYLPVRIVARYSFILDGERYWGISILFTPTQHVLYVGSLGVKFVKLLHHTQS